MTETKPKAIKSLVRRPLLAAALAACAVVPAPALAAVDMFLKIDGVEGESTFKGHEKWIQLSSYSVGFANQAAAGGSGAAVGKSTCSPFSVSKSVDKSSPPLLSAVMAGQRFSKAQIELVRSGGDGGVGAVYLKYELSDVIISSLEEGGSSGGGTPQEQAALQQVEHRLFDAECRRTVGSPCHCRSELREIVPRPGRH
jgi:type VI secretion system secreted protein Hcp